MSFPSSTSSIRPSGAAPAALLAGYRPGDALWLSPTGCRLGRGTLASTGNAPASRPRDRDAAEGAGMLFGAVPFDIREPARLVVPERLLAAPGMAPGDGAARPAPVRAARLMRCDAVPPPAGYEERVARAQALFPERGLSKVVLARTLDAALETPPALPELVATLAARNTHGYTYAVPLAAGGAFVGASPELLVRRTGLWVTVNPLAGSAPRVANAVEDRRIAEALLHSPKDRHEHAIVIDAVARALRPLCRTLAVPPVPELIATDAMWHLATLIEGELADPAVTALDLALALHPTPAVCGTPTAAAFDAIAALEPFDRGLFSGFVGWCDARGDGEWAVALRCADIRGDRVRLYAGAGIVAESVPAAERRETGAKFRTMLRALGVADPDDQ